MDTSDAHGANDLPAIAVRSLMAMATGSREEFDAVTHADAIDRENSVQPPSSRVRGPAGFYATALWLREAFADLDYDIENVVADGDLVVLYSTMKGRHVGTFVVYDERGDVDTAFPSTGKSFAMAQSHWFKFRDGKVVEHWATRDDVGQAKQLGWIPPTPPYLIRMARAKRRAQH